MKSISAIAVVLLTACATGSTPSIDPVTTIDGIELHASFWQNLHLTLYGEARATLPDVAELRHVIGIPDGPLPGALTPSEREAWDAALGWYQEHLARLDLRVGEGMTPLHWALASSGETLEESPAIPAGLRGHLLAAAPVYRAHWWADQQSAIHAWIDDVATRVEQMGPDFPDRLAELLGTEWFTEPVRADITFYGRAFTTIDPDPLTIIAISDPAYTEWAGAEMLFHEVGHALAAPLRNRIREAADAAGKNPRDLWHVVQFYIVGEFWRLTLADHGIEYVPYMEANGLFDRAWSAVRDPVETAIDPYLAGDVDLAAAIRELVELIPE